jgi:hypothetical protein
MTPSLFAVPEVSATLMVAPGNELTVTDSEIEATQFVDAFVTVTA